MFKPHVTVACVIQCQNRYLIVEEEINGKFVYNQPAGHLEQNESLLEAAHRELYEETGLRADITHLCGTYLYNATPSLTFLRICFVGKVDTASDPSPKDPDIHRAMWKTLEELKVQDQRMRSPMVIQCIEDALNKAPIPLSFLQEIV